MLLSSLNTGSTDLRDTDVQQPNTTATLSCEISWRAFSANSGQFDAGSTTTGSSFLPSTPPLALISSIAISVTSLSTVSLIAIVPDSECRTPTLMVPWASAGTADTAKPHASATGPTRDNARLTIPISMSRDISLTPQVWFESELARRCRQADGLSHDPCHAPCGGRGR